MKNIFWGEEKSNESNIIAGSETIVKEPNYVEVVLNRIYFYSEIYRDQILQLNKNLRMLQNSNLYDAAVQEREVSNIFLHINSYGGSIFSGFSAMDEILKSKVPIFTIVDGCCASAATFLSIVGKKRFIRPNAFMLIHQLSSVAWGKFNELEDARKNNVKLMERIKQIYFTYTKIPEEKINEILDHDLWFDAETCLKYGLVDEIN
jgi:ATP-dependent Clp endopeptidase proteolytic subunit ClpP